MLVDASRQIPVTTTPLRVEASSPAPQGVSAVPSQLSSASGLQNGTPTSRTFLESFIFYLKKLTDFLLSCCKPFSSRLPPLTQGVAQSLVKDRHQEVLNRVHRTCETLRNTLQRLPQTYPNLTHPIPNNLLPPLPNHQPLTIPQGNATDLLTYRMSQRYEENVISQILSAHTFLQLLACRADPNIRMIPPLSMPSLFLFNVHLETPISINEFHIQECYLYGKVVNLQTLTHILYRKLFIAYSIPEFDFPRDPISRPAYDGAPNQPLTEAALNRWQGEFLSALNNLDRMHAAYENHLSQHLLRLNQERGSGLMQRLINWI